MEGSAVLQRPTAAPRSRRAGSRPGFVQRYWAFVSYSHRDKAHADWLHEALEQFPVPKTMIGRGTRYGLVPARLSPVFRDKEDLAAGDDLRDDIQAAIAASRFMVVLCSPAAVASRWVNQEIELFRRLRPDGEIFAAILGGEPWASDIPGREADECFPPALKQAYDEDGEPTGERAEPVAADFREARDGRQLGLQKIVAGMLDVGLDELVQRDSQRRHRRMVVLTAGSVAGMLLTTGLSVAALQARDEARDQRREAESLIEFMIGDLKDKLEPVGRLDALGAVGSRVLAYYERQDKGDLADDALAQRSKALTLMGDIAQRRGDIQGALKLYREGLDSTAEALRRDPDNPQRLFDHAQNVFWIGELARQLDQTDRAEEAFRQYKQLADRMLALEPSNPSWQMEALYAATNLGIVLHETRRYPAAIAEFERALAAAEALTRGEPASEEFRSMRLETLAWLADAQLGAGRMNDAVATRRVQLQSLDAALRTEGENMSLLQQEVPARRSLGRMLAFRGDLRGARQQLERAVGVAEQLIGSEPDNMIWLQLAAGAQLDLSGVLLASTELEPADKALVGGCEKVERLQARDGRKPDLQSLMVECFSRRARLALARGAPGEALVWSGQALAAAQSLSGGDGVERAFAVAAVYRLIGDVHQEAGDMQAAQSAWRTALRTWPNAPHMPQRVALKADLLRKVGRATEARPIEAQLTTMGFRQII